MLFGKKQVISVNISDQRLKLVFLARQRSNIAVKAAAQVDLEEGLIERGRIRDDVRLEKIFRDLLIQAGGEKYFEEDIVIIFPEAGVFSHFFRAISRDENKLKGKILEEARSSIPLNKEELLFDYKIIEKHKSDTVFKARASIVGANKQLVEEWVNFFKKLQVNVDKFAIESISTYYGLNLQGISRPLCIVDIGANITSVAIFSDIGLEHSHSFFCAGNFFTKKISEGIKSGETEKMNVADAEKIKIELGSFAQKNYEDPAVVLKSAILPVVEDVAAAINFFQESRRKTIEHVILIGGSSNIKGVAEYIASNLSASIAVVEDLPPAKIKVSLGASLFGNVPIEFVSAVGAAFVHLHDNMRKEQLMLPAELLERNGNESAAIKEPEDDDEVSEENVSWFASHTKEVALILILIVGVVLIGSAFWYRSHSIKKTSKKDLTLLLKSERAITWQVPTYITSNEASAEKARVRLIRRVVRVSENIDDVKERAPEEMKTQIKKGESLWPTPLETANASTSAVEKKRPEIVFLVYVDSLLKVVLEANLKKELGTGIDFLVKDVSLQNVAIKDSKYYLSLDFKLLTATEADSEKLLKYESGASVSQRTAVDKNASSSILAETEKVTEPTTLSLQELSLLYAAKKSDKKVIVKQSSIGFVNIRSAPDVKASLVKKAYFGEEFSFLEEREGWVKVAVGTSTEAWIKNDLVIVK